jgi:hypothetical protein
MLNRNVSLMSLSIVVLEWSGIRLSPYYIVPNIMVENTIFVFPSGMCLSKLTKFLVIKLSLNLTPFP